MTRTPVTGAELKELVEKVSYPGRIYLLLDYNGRGWYQLWKKAHALQLGTELKRAAKSADELTDDHMVYVDVDDSGSLTIHVQLQ
jgi:hypothetical protein